MRTASRGSTLVETMLASSLLLLGMVGVVQLILSGVNQNAMANGRATGQELAGAGAAMAMALPFTALPLGISDGGILSDGDGRRYGRTITTTEFGDGGTRARLVIVETDWVDFMGAVSIPRRARVSVIISEVPDAGF
ncbi:MAG: hypothetical protein Q8N26_04790 [Myxococcales bacterium]|nr:hypothetical protein [Myxococcales bacterium]